MMMSTVISLIVSIKECATNGWELPQFYFRVGDSDLARSRNVIIGRFLDTDCTDLVLVDSDISWAPGTLTRLVSHKKDFVAGAYKGKTDEKEMYFILWPEKKEMWTDPETGNPLLKVDGVSIGFCRIARSCVEKLVASLDGKRLHDPAIPDETFPWLIDFEYHNGIRWEEGYTLCRKWRELGGDVWVDPMINLGHMGAKIWESNLIGYLEKMQNIAASEEMVSVRDEKIENAFLEGLPREAAE